MFAITERLLLRPPWGEDSMELFRAIADEPVVRNLATAPWPYLPCHAESWAATPRPAHRPAALIFLRGAGAPELVGGIGIHDMPDGEVELGYWVARERWGAGIATEAGQAVLRFARDALRLPRLIAGHFLDNPASGQVLHKLGFQPTGIVRMRHSLARGGDAPMAEFVVELNRREGDAQPVRMAA
jgi:RimJ/RimL family protein N-acetyltransferase